MKIIYLFVQKKFRVVTYFQQVNQLFIVLPNHCVITLKAVNKFWIILT